MKYEGSDRIKRILLGLKFVIFVVAALAAAVYFNGGMR